MHRIVILGAGFGGLHIYLRLNRYFPDRRQIRLTLVNQNNYFLYSTMLHELATGSVSKLAVTQAIREIMRRHPQDAFYQAKVEKIDPGRKRVLTAAGEIAYDTLVIALGAKANVGLVPGAAQHAFTIKTLACAVRLRNHIIRLFERASKETIREERLKMLHFVIIGGGYTGIELAGQLSDLLHKEFPVLYPQVPQGEVRISVILGRDDRVLPQCGPYLSRKADQRLKRLKIGAIAQTRAKEITPEGVTLDNGQTIATLTPIWTAGIRPATEALLPSNFLDERGYIKVNATLQSAIDPNIFALGDIAAVSRKEGGPHPRLAQTAQQQGKFLARNLRNRILGRPLRRFRYHHRGDIVPIGDWFALANIGGLRFTGRLAWFIRRTVFLQNIYSFTDKLQTVFDWTIRLFKPRDTAEM